MSINPVISMIGRKLRLAVIGGGPGSFIGKMHRVASRLDNRYEIVTGILSSNIERSKNASQELGFSNDRIYSNVPEMFDKEAMREDSIDVVAIMTPNDTHYEYSVAALEKGFDVICDKPMTNTLEEALALHKKVKETNLVFCLTHNYTGYPMVRQARAMVENGELGIIRLVQVEYVQGGKAKEPEQHEGKLPWRYDPVKGGPSLVMGDIGTHAHNLIRFITCLEVTEVAAEIGCIVPNRIAHDFGSAMLRFNNGARGSYWVTQVAAGVENCLRIRVSGNKGTLEWMQEIPQILTFKLLEGPAQLRTPNGPGSHPLTVHSSRIVAGHPEGFPEGFANIYSDAAIAIAARRSDKKPDPLAMYFPDSSDGLAGVHFVAAAIESSNANGIWVKCPASF